MTTAGDATYPPELRSVGGDTIPNSNLKEEAGEKVENSLDAFLSRLRLLLGGGDDQQGSGDKERGRADEREGARGSVRVGRGRQELQTQGV